MKNKRGQAGAIFIIIIPIVFIALPLHGAGKHPCTSGYGTISKGDTGSNGSLNWKQKPVPLMHNYRCFYLTNTSF